MLESDWLAYPDERMQVFGEQAWVRSLAKPDAACTAMPGEGPAIIVRLLGMECNAAALSGIADDQCSKHLGRGLCPRLARVPLCHSDVVGRPQADRRPGGWQALQPRLDEFDACPVKFERDCQLGIDEQADTSPVLIAPWSESSWFEEAAKRQAEDAARAASWAFSAACKACLPDKLGYSVGADRHACDVEDCPVKCCSAGGRCSVGNRPQAAAGQYRRPGPYPAGYHVRREEATLASC